MIGKVLPSYKIISWKHRSFQYNLLTKLIKVLSSASTTLTPAIKTLAILRLTRIFDVTDVLR